MFHPSSVARDNGHSFRQEPKLLAKRPLKWSFTDAAALPTVFATVDEAFRDADLKVRVFAAAICISKEELIDLYKHS